MKLLKRILLGLVVLFIATQFVRPAKNIAASPSADDITAHHPTSPEVRRLLTAACYDCHSNTTRYPWYAEIQPLGWWLAAHVDDGKRHLNFSRFSTYAPDRAIHKLEEVIDTVTTREMPLSSYTRVHTDARLTEAQIKLLTDWADAVSNRIIAHHKLAD